MTKTKEELESIIRALRYNIKEKDVVLDKLAEENAELKEIMRKLGQVIKPYAD